MTGLKPCQCGAKARLSHKRVRIGTATPHLAISAHVHCQKNSCGHQTRVYRGGQAKEKAIKAWNHRPIEDELVEALEMAMSEIDQMKPTEALVAVSLIGRAALKRARGES